MEETTKKNNAFFRQAIFLLVLFAIGLVIFKQLQFFVGSFLGAITIYVVLRKVMFRLTDKYGIHKWVASLILVLATAVVLTGFGYLLVRAVASEMSNLDTKQLIDIVNTLPEKLNSALGMTLIPSDIIEKSDGVIQTVVSSAINTTYSFTANIFMMLVISYFMFTAGRKMEHQLFMYAPFKERSLCLLKKEASTMIYSNAVGMPIILVAQMLTSTLIYWLLGMDNIFFWGFLTAICGLVPLLGTALVYIPIAIYMLMNGEVWQGIALILYGLTIISNTDNVFRIVLMKKIADTHPLIVIFGVILGIPLFGFWGIIFGPLLISGFMLLIRIYYVEYGLIEHPSDDELNMLPAKRVPKHFSKIAKKTGTRCK